MFSFPFVDNFFVKISFYANGRNKYKLIFGSFTAFESTFKALKSENFAFYMTQIASFDTT